MKTVALPKGPSPVKTSLVSPIFADGRVVSADDLHLAMSYPLDVFRVMMRAFFGCGIVCGLELERDKRLDTLGKEVRDKQAVASHKIRIMPGVALDCHGHPIQLCRAVDVDLSPDPCDCGETPKCLCIAIRRTTSEEQPRADDPCGCPTEPSRYACSRLQERVEIRVYDPDDPPRELCWHAPGDGLTPCSRDEKKGEEKGDDKWRLVDPDRATTCACLKNCAPHECCGDSWVYLGCVELDENEGAVPNGKRWRRYVKPIDCHCRQVTAKEEEPPQTDQTYAVVDERATSATDEKKTRSRGAKSHPSSSGS